ncbi:phage tail protein [Tsukamurella tyrosinosolvens]|uniref:phage tail protein n=1 Tax=Tsukamurella tyrosinosolvens TaxID=57704 RepID=UPI002DD4210A|nr:phage tail protein [Tsukamurella tyrosinosolvens]MEC4616182.1 phage tail protein [Tsukamurella tyrosinosolvens]
MSAPIPGQPIHMADILTVMHVSGVVGDGETPPMATATFELVGDDSVLTLPVLKGDKGDDGEPSPIVDMETDYSVIQEPSDLASLSLGPADKGRTWWFPGDATAYYWTGTGFMQRPIGSQGRPGPTPQITVTAERVAPGSGSTVVQSGTASNPVLHFKLDPPAGPPGPAAAITLASDYDNSAPPENGQVVTWNSLKDKWEPSDFVAKHPMFFSVPESAFTSMSTIVNGRQNILSFPMPALDYAWVPVVMGRIKAIGIDLNILNPFKIGAEVRLGDPLTGTLIGRGVGSIAQECVFLPHFSSPGDPDVSVSPDNGVAQVNAGQATTINVNLVNDGLIGLYAFNNQNAQLAVLCIPQGE